MTHIIMYVHVCTQVRTTVYGRGGRGLRGPVGVGWCACDMTNINTPTSLGWEGSEGGLYIMQVLRTLSDLGGGVNGHDVNLREECDDVTG